MVLKLPEWSILILPGLKTEFHSIVKSHLVLQELHTISIKELFIYSPAGISLLYKTSELLSTSTVLPACQCLSDFPPLGIPFLIDLPSQESLCFCHQKWMPF